VEKKLSLGIIETKGLTAAIRAADEMLKSAYVEIAGIERIGSGLVALTIIGDLSSVKAAIEVGISTVQTFGKLVASHVIPKPYAVLNRLTALPEDFCSESQEI